MNTVSFKHKIFLYLEYVMTQVGLQPNIRLNKWAQFQM